MRPEVVLPVLLIVIGAVGLAFGALTYRHREKILGIGPIQAAEERDRTIPFPPILGGLAVASGMAWLLYSRRRA